MTGPKHLWSGDWERESAATSGAEANRRQDREDPTVGGNAATSPSREPETTAPTRRRRNRIAVATTLALLVIAGIAIAATSVGSDPTPASAPTAAALAPPTNPTPPAQPTNPNPTNPAPTTPNPANPNPALPTPTSPNPSTPNPATPPPPPSSTATTPTVAPQPVNWLGMEIITIPSGAAVVDTVSRGGAGDRAGLTPADTIVQIDNHAVTGSTSIARAVRGKHKGDSVTVTVVRGGTSLDVQTTFTGPPTAYP